MTEQKKQKPHDVHPVRFNKKGTDQELLMRLFRASMKSERSMSSQIKFWLKKYLNIKI